jgi:hypothetical protein
MTPARAVEVAALFEDSVITVKHLTERRTPDARITKALLIGGALALVGALGTFIASVHQIAVLERAHEAAVAAHRASGPFVVPSGGRELDLIVALCLVAGTWALFLGAARWLAGRTSPHFTVGPTPGADVSVPLDANVPLVHRSDNGWLVNLTAPMRGEMSQGSEPPAPLQVPSQIAIREGTRAFVDLGALRFIVGTTEMPPRIASPLRIDWAREAYIGGVGLAAGIFLGFLYMIPPDPKSLAVDPIRSDIFASFVIKAPQLPDPPVKKGLFGGPGGGSSRHKGPSGIAGSSKVSPDKHGQLRIKGDSRDMKLGRQLANQAASRMGILGVLSAQEVSSIGSLWHEDERALGHDAENVMGNLIGTTGEGFGREGAGVVGDKDGGGGRADTIGVNPLANIHGGPGGGGGYYPPGNKIGLGTHTVRNVEPIPTPHIIAGAGLSKDIIKRVIHFHHNEVKFCYDKRLAVKQTLGGGRVVARFLIGGNGRVVNSLIESSTLADAAVEGCIAEAIRRWDFPRPSDGSLVQVSYPFVLHAPGE